MDRWEAMKDSRMTKHLLFIQGAGEGAFEEDKALAKSLRQSLGPDYDVHYPAMPDEENAPYEQWKQHIRDELAGMYGSVVLVGHSVGGSVLAKCIGDLKVEQPIVGIFLIAAPFWGGDGWRYEGYEEYELPKDVASKVPSGASVFLCHCRDDAVVSFDHLALFAEVFPQAKVRAIDKGGHQFNNDLSDVARDIKSLFRA
jgi:predicted alpha/beta hydrolase family esterase